MEHDGKSVEHVIKRLKEASKIAQENGSAICIGYVEPEGGTNTATAIAQMLSWFDENNIEWSMLPRSHKDDAPGYSALNQPVAPPLFSQPVYE